MHTSEILRRFMLFFLINTSFGGIALAQTEELPLRIDGDIGLGSYYTRSIIHGKTNQVSILPYGNFDYGRIFMRIDTLGIKTMKLGYGYLEIAGRISQDGFNTDVINLHGLDNRQTSIPLGLGTLQITPIGAFFINAFHDINKSKGNLFEVIYVAELDTPQVTFYPLAGAEYQSKEYVRYYYGITAQEASSSQYPAYQPTGAFNPLLGLMIDARLTEEYHLNFYLRRKWLGNAIQSSPIVGQKFMDTGFIALSYRFE
jgi:outer membrane protein